MITIDVLHLVFSAFGYVCKIATFEKQAGFQALIQYPDPATAETVRPQALFRIVHSDLNKDFQPTAASLESSSFVIETNFHIISLKNDYKAIVRNYSQQYFCL